jgi:cytochrome c-type biogenesis protein CcmE
MKRYRAFLIPAIGLIVVLVGFLAYGLLNDSLVYFKTPTELQSEPVRDSRLRLGGQVVGGTVVQQVDSVSFEIGDGTTAVAVRHEGAPSQLFAEEIGVVVEGRWDGSVFYSDTMLIKHDEQYRTDDGSVYRPGAGLED